MAHLYYLILTYKYWLLLPLVTIEGPIATMVSSFFVSLGVLNVYLVFVVVVLGDVLGDVIYYWIGRKGGKKLVGKYGKRLGLTAERLEKTKNHTDRHLGKTVFIGKLIQAPVFIIMIAAGMTKYDFRKYIMLMILVSIPKALLYMVIGYYFGEYYQIIDVYLTHASRFIFFFFATLILIWFFTRETHKETADDEKSLL
jgi:membrane protein DedA with SNARE-associated domain